jgi:hypothetical protein
LDKAYAQIKIRLALNYKLINVLVGSYYKIITKENIMKKFGFLSAIVLMFLCTISVFAANKYDIKSGIVTLESIMIISKTMSIKTTKIIYFDDFGAKEREETYANGKLNGVRFADGKDKFSLSINKKTAIKEGAGDRGLGPQVDINFFGTTKDIESGIVKKMPPMILAGQTCEVFQYKKGKNLQIHASWNKVLVYSKLESTEIKAVKIEPNAKIPKDKFQIPAGFTLR